MIPPQAPIDPQQPIEPQEPIEPRRSGAFWDYADLGMFLFLAIASLFVALLLLRIPFLRDLKESYRLLVGQMIWYILALGSLAFILYARYRRRFWPSLGWRLTPMRSAAASFLAGPLIAIGLGLIGVALRTPQIKLPFETMLSSTALIVLFGLLVVIVGPVCEELAFRGFLLPLLVRSLGPAAGIVLAGALFGMLHGFEYPDWRHVVLIGVAGMIFGWRRYETGSTIHAALMHAGFNLMQFATLMAAGHAHLR